jgi:KipI family sensor histidine kinase inhibitor
VQVLPAGDRAVLVALGRIPARDLHAAAILVRAMEGVLACIVGEESLYVIFQKEPPSVELWERVFSEPFTGDVETRRRHVLRVGFAERQACDLAEFLRRVRITRSEFLERVAQIRLTARFLGFRAGFAYLDGWPSEWQMPRRPTSRPVPRGSFAIAGAMAGFYPIDTPGGWNILGRTAAVLWDPARTPPNLIAAGDEIAIDPTDEEIVAAIEPRAPVESLDGVEIVSGGQLTTIVRGADYGRIDEGRSPGGPFDARAALAANRAVGNRDDAALLECALSGPRVRFTRPATVAWSGAPCELPALRALVVEAGQELTIGRLRGMRGYLAVGDARGEMIPSLVDDHRTIAVARGPHDIGLGDIECEVTPQLDRVGIRLRPLTPIDHRPPADLRSSGMQFGSVQLHPDGSLVAMGPDHPITGGYLQPMTVLWNERWKLARLEPGERIRFVIRQLPKP